jgi:hypothetical protein
MMSPLVWFLLALIIMLSGPFVTRVLRPKSLLIWAAVLLLIYLGLCNLPDYAATNGSPDAAGWITYFALIGWGALINIVMIVRQIAKLFNEGYR